MADGVTQNCNIFMFIFLFEGPKCDDNALYTHTGTDIGRISSLISIVAVAVAVAVNDVGDWQNYNHVVDGRNKEWRPMWTFHCCLCQMPLLHVYLSAIRVTEEVQCILAIWIYNTAESSIDLMPLHPNKHFDSGVVWLFYSRHSYGRIKQ